MALFHINGLPVGAVAVMLALITSMGGFMFGYDTTQISEILVMDDFKLRFATCSNPTDVTTCEFTTVRAGLIVSLLSIGTLAGALLGAPVADKIGRRYAMITECCIFCVGVVVQITTSLVWQQVAVGRFISGLAVGALSAVIPMYQAETAPSQIRGSLTATFQLFLSFGITVAYCIGIGTRLLPGAASWRALIGINLIWPPMLAIGILFMPESPRWLAANGRLKEAERSVARAHGVKREDQAQSQVVQSIVRQIANQVEAESHLEPSDWISCFKPENRTLYRTLLGMALQSLQQLTGANYFFYYGATIFQSVGLKDNFVTQTILGAVNFVCTFGGMYVMERYGRRIPLILGGIWQSVWLFVFAIAGTVKDPTTNSDVGMVMIVSACMFILGYSVSWSPGIWIIIGEIFPTRTRARQGALATSSNWLFNFLLAFFTPFIVSAIRFRYGFIFAACNLAGAIVVYFFLYESSNLSLESVDDMYNDPNCKPWTSRTWAPVGYSSRSDFAHEKKTVETKTTFDNGAFEENATGRVTTTTGSVSSFENEKSKENEKSGTSNGVKVAVSGVSRSSSILENQGRGMGGSGAEIVGAGVDV